MRADTVARRYARAIFELANDQGTVDAIAHALASTAGLFADPQIAGVLTGPVPREQKLALLRGISEDIGAPPAFRDLLLVLAEHDRLGHLAAIRAVFDTLVDRKRGRTRAKVCSATALPAEVVSELARVFGAITGKEVIPELTVDAELIAGVIVEIEGRVYDGSLRTQLGKLRQQMASGS